MSSTDDDFVDQADDELDDDLLTLERPTDLVSMAAYVLAFLAVGAAVLQGVIQLLIGDGNDAITGSALSGGFSAVVSGAVGVLAVALGGLSLKRARSGEAIQEGVARTALFVGGAAVILSLVVLVVQVNSLDRSPLFSDTGSGFSVP